MENLRDKIVSTALGASSGLTGLLAVSNCSGKECTSCFSCAGVGIGIILLVLFGRMKASKKDEN